MRRSYIVFMAVLLSVGALAFAMALRATIKGEETAPPKPTVEWVGHPMISNNDPYTPSQAWLPGFQIGFRSDGVVVWREVPKGK